MTPEQRRETYNILKNDYTSLVKKCLPGMRDKQELLRFIMTLKYYGNPFGIYKRDSSFFSKFKRFNFRKKMQETKTTRTVTEFFDKRNFSALISSDSARISSDKENIKEMGNLMRIALDQLAEALIEGYGLQEDIKEAVKNQPWRDKEKRADAEGEAKTPLSAGTSSESGIEMTRLQTKADKWWSTKSADDQKEIKKACETEQAKKQLARISNLPSNVSGTNDNPLYYYIASKNLLTLWYPEIVEAKETIHIKVAGDLAKASLSGGGGDGILILAFIAVLLSLVIYAGHHVYDAFKEGINSHTQAKLSGLFRLSAMIGTGVSSYWLVPWVVPLLVGSATPIGQMVLVGLALVCAAAVVSKYIAKIACWIKNKCCEPDAISYWDYSKWELSADDRVNIEAQGANPEAVRDMLKTIKAEADTIWNPLPVWCCGSQRLSQLESMRDNLRTRPDLLQPCFIGEKLYFPNASVERSSVAASSPREPLLSKAASQASRASEFGFGSIQGNFRENTGGSKTGPTLAKLSGVVSSVASPPQYEPADTKQAQPPAAGPEPEAVCVIS